MLPGASIGKGVTAAGRRGAFVWTGGKPTHNQGKNPDDSPKPFEHLSSNRYMIEKPRTTEHEVCMCKSTDKVRTECVPSSLIPALGTCGDDCLNRQMMYECTCCHADCQNQRLQKRQYPRLECCKTSDGRGWGLWVLEDVPKGALIQEYIGEVISSSEFRDRANRYLTDTDTPVYFFQLDSQTVIDSGAMGSMARFINHSCDPNCNTEIWKVGGERRVAIVSSRAIRMGTEVTINYQFESFGLQQHPCLCGAVNCTGFLDKRTERAKNLEHEKAVKRKGTEKKSQRKKKYQQTKEGQVTGCRKFLQPFGPSSSKRNSGGVVSVRPFALCPVHTSRPDGRSLPLPCPPE